MANFRLDLTGISLNQGKPYYDFINEKHHDDIVDIKFSCSERVIDQGIEQRKQKSQLQQDCPDNQLTTFVKRLPKHGKFVQSMHSREKVSRILPGQ